jgi:hypothetical protein
MKYILIALPLLLTACGESEQQRLYRQQQQLAQQQQQLNYQQQQMTQQHQGWEQPQQYQQGYAPAPIMQQPAPVIVQQPSSSGSSHMTDMLVGGLVGHAIGNAMGNRSAPAYNHPPAPVTNITRNVTINRAPVARPSAARRR